jgi:hypothetical protein
VAATLNEQVKTLQGQVEADFGRHPDGTTCLSQPCEREPVERPGEQQSEHDRHRAGRPDKHMFRVSTAYTPEYGAPALAALAPHDSSSRRQCSAA